MGYEYESFISDFTKSAPCNPGYELTEALGKFVYPSLILKERDELQTTLTQSITGKTPIEMFLEDQQKAYEFMSRVSYELERIRIKEAIDEYDNTYAVLFQKATVDDVVLNRLVIENGAGETVKEEYYEGEIDLNNEIKRLAEESVEMANEERDDESRDI